VSPHHHRTARRLVALALAALLLAACGGSEIDTAELVAPDRPAGRAGGAGGDGPPPATSTTLEAEPVAEEPAATTPSSPEAVVVEAVAGAAEQGYRFDMVVGISNDPSLVDPAMPEEALDELDRVFRGFTAAGLSDGVGGASVVFGSEYDRSFSLTIRVVDEVAYATSSLIDDRWLSVPAPQGSGGLAPAGFPVDDLLDEVAAGVLTVEEQPGDDGEQVFVVDLEPPPLDPVLTGEEPLAPGDPIPLPGVTEAEITLDPDGAVVEVFATYQVGTTVRVDLYDHEHGTTVEEPETSEPMDALSFQELVQGSYVA
jgi:hypothetical protein